MMSRVDDMPVYQQQISEVTAVHYNLWRRAKSHFTLPVRFSLNDLRGLVMILDQREWLCADESLNDLPVICWNEFVDERRDTLHLPVKCQLNYYHFAAFKIRDQVLELMELELGNRLQAISLLDK
jgi:hypothetical protein